MGKAILGIVVLLASCIVASAQQSGSYVYAVTDRLSCREVPSHAGMETSSMWEEEARPARDLIR
ncbi:MAG: hypothetical protein MUP80_03885 [Acidobacteriia bacterium]|nr:hypothetical protein [Terriglobia bacterium]